MSQFDFGDLESPLSGSNFINANLEPWRDALHSLHKGPSTPSYAVAGMMWIDDSASPWVLNIFDGTDNISVGTVDPTTNTFTPSGVSQAAADISVDNSGFTVFGGDDVQEVLGEVDTFAASLGTAAFDDTGDFATAAQGDTADDIDTLLKSGTAGQVLKSPGGGGVPVWGGSGLSLELLGDYATTSGTSIDVTSIPADTKEIWIHFNGVSVSSVASPLIQIGDAGGVETTGYSSFGNTLTSGGVAGQSSTSGFILSGGGLDATAVVNGVVKITIGSGNAWSVSGSVANNTGTNYAMLFSGQKILSDVLDRLRLTTPSGNFDAGSITIQLLRQS